MRPRPARFANVSRQASRRVRRVRDCGLTGSTDRWKSANCCRPPTNIPELSDENIAAYEAALDALLSRNWTTGLLSYCTTSRPKIA